MMTDIENLVESKRRLEAENARLRGELAAMARLAEENGRLRLVVSHLHKTNTELSLKMTRRELAESLEASVKDGLEDVTTDLDDKVQRAAMAGEQRAQDPHYRRVG